MILLHNLPIILKDSEERRIITGVSWQDYESLLADQEDNLPYRIAYLEGVLEIVAPSRRHESQKTRIGTFLEVYFEETDTEYFPMGSTTLRQGEKQAGGEPDESYCLGEEKEFPDLVIEVVITSGSINRLDLYGRLGVQEVWFWQKNQFLLYILRKKNSQQFRETFGYELVTRSELLNGLDITVLSECLEIANPLMAAKVFRQRLRASLS